MSTNQRTTTRRRVLQTGALGALAAGLLGSAGTAPAAAAPQSAPPVLPRLVDESHLIAASKAVLAEYLGKRDAYLGVERRFRDLLTAEQATLWNTVQDAYDAYRDTATELEWAELKRHLPIVAIAMDIIRNDHAIGWLDKIGVCCTAEAEA